jgi:hypothetical protein
VEPEVQGGVEVEGVGADVDVDAGEEEEEVVVVAHTAPQRRSQLPRN